MSEAMERLGLDMWQGAAVGDLLALGNPRAYLLINGALPIWPKTFARLREYSRSLPTGTNEGKVWKAQYGAGWFLGRYGPAYPEGHQYARQVPIEWFPILIRGRAARFPRNVIVPPPVMRGRQRPAPLGDDEGQLCLRPDHQGGVCRGVIEYLPDATFGGCGCSTSPMPPCSYCTSTQPECPACGWRD